MKERGRESLEKFNLCSHFNCLCHNVSTVVQSGLQVLSFIIDNFRERENKTLQA